MIVGVISDTHGLLREEAVLAMAGSDVILHAGDIGAPEILERLKTIAPVHAVRGNVDTKAWAHKIPQHRTVTLGKYRIAIVHARPDFRLEDKHPAVVIFGHSHKPGIEERGGILYFNPGSAGPRRFRLPVTCGRLLLESDSIKPEIIELLR